MGDLETEFLKKIEDKIAWPDIDILFAPHHGRDSRKIPESVLSTIDPKIIIVGEAPSKHLNYYNLSNAITQNTAEGIVFECVDNCVHIYVEKENHEVDFLFDYGKNKYKNYIGTLDI